MVDVAAAIDANQVLLKKMYRKAIWQFSRSVDILGREMKLTSLDSPK